MLAREVRLQFSPTIRFKLDESFDEASRIEGLLHDPAVARDLARDDDVDDEIDDDEPRTATSGTPATRTRIDGPSQEGPEGPMAG